MQIYFDFAERENIGRNSDSAVNPCAAARTSRQKAAGHKSPSSAGRPEESRPDKGAEALGATTTSRDPSRGLWRVVFSSLVLSP